MSERASRSEIRRRYREEGTPMGVFAIRNTANGKVLVGSAKNLPGALNSHRFQLRLGSHRNRELQREWNELGEACFAFEVLDELEPSRGVGEDYADDLAALEALWLEKLRPYGDAGYHRAPPGA
ncbi:MAG TPA: GIY-YIG nuclease family protein [Longimicrobium sp.]|jgi:hypothetical protein